MDERRFFRLSVSGGDEPRGGVSSPWGAGHTPSEMILRITPDAIGGVRSVADRIRPLVEETGGAVRSVEYRSSGIEVFTLEYPDPSSDAWFPDRVLRPSVPWSLRIRPGVPGDPGSCATVSLFHPGFDVESDLLYLERGPWDDGRVLSTLDGVDARPVPVGLHWRTASGDWNRCRVPMDPFAGAVSVEDVPDAFRDSIAQAPEDGPGRLEMALGSDPVAPVRRVAPIVIASADGGDPTALVVDSSWPLCRESLSGDAGRDAGPRP